MIISADLGVAGLIDVGYRFYTTAEVAVAARVTAGIVDAGNGWYSADVTIPSNAASVRWDSTGTATAIAREYFDADMDASFAVVNTKLDAIDDYIDTEVAAIKSKTDNLPADPADASDIAASFATVNGKLDAVVGAVDTEIAAIKAKTDALPSDPADASDIAASFAGLNTKVDTIDDFLDTEIAAIKAKTDALPADPADASDIAAQFAVTNAKLDVIDDYVDVEIAAIKVTTDKLDTALELDGAVYRYTTNALEQAPAGGGGGGTGDASQATLLAVKAKTDNLPDDPADASDIATSFATVNTKLDAIDDYVDTEVAAIKAKTDQLTFTAGKVDANATLALVAGDLTAIADAILKRDWTAVSGEATYSLLQAARQLRNVWGTAGGTLIVKKEDGTTTAWTRTLTTDPTAQPITGAS